MEDDPAEHSRKHEIRARVDDADSDCAACKGESACKQSPHDCIEE